MAIIDFLLQRSVIIGLAVIGAIIVVLGTYLCRRRVGSDPTHNDHGRRVLKLGYTIAWISVALFIVAGFRSAYV